MRLAMISGDSTTVDLMSTTPNPIPISGTEVVEVGQFVVSAVSELQHHVVGVEGVHVGEKCLPGTILDRLPTVVAEAHVDGRCVRNGIQDDIERACSPLGLFGMARDVGFIQLDDLSVNLRNLRRQDLTDRVRQILNTTVMPIEQGLAQHVGTRHCELERGVRQTLDPFVVGYQVQRALVERTGYDAGRLGPKSHARLIAEIGNHPIV